MVRKNGTNLDKVPPLKCPVKLIVYEFPMVTGGLFKKDNKYIFVKHLFSPNLIKKLKTAFGFVLRTFVQKLSKNEFIKIC